MLIKSDETEGPIVDSDILTCGGDSVLHIIGATPIPYNLTELLPNLAPEGAAPTSPASTALLPPSAVPLAGAAGALFSSRSPAVPSEAALEAAAALQPPAQAAAALPPSSSPAAPSQAAQGALATFLPLVQAAPALPPSSSPAAPSQVELQAAATLLLPASAVEAAPPPVPAPQAPAVTPLPANAASSAAAALLLPAPAAEAAGGEAAPPPAPEAPAAASPPPTTSADSAAANLTQSLSSLGVSTCLPLQDLYATSSNFSSLSALANAGQIWVRPHILHSAAPSACHASPLL